ncbi:MAG: patatin-like phospholipase family protein [Methyloligellaceae bacterium]
MYKKQNTHQKRLLALDGGGILAITSLMILKKIEDDLKSELQVGDDFRLCHFFDYIGGTSSGAIIAAGLATGMKVDELIELYTQQGKRMFTTTWPWKRLHHKYCNKPLAKMLQQYLGDKTIEELNNTNSPEEKKLQSLLMIVTRNSDTKSPWPLSTNTNGRYYEFNKIIKLWQLVRASTAAPTYFPPEPIQVDDTNKFHFEDGGITAYNNPAFQLYRMATMPQYRIGWCNNQKKVIDPWTTGEDNMMLVSVGVGQPFEVTSKRNNNGNLLWKSAKEVPGALMQGVSSDQDINCRMIGRCVYGTSIDREIGDLIPRDDNGVEIPLSHNLGRAFLYARYEADISRKGLKKLGINGITPDNLDLDSIDKIPELVKIGNSVAESINFKSGFSNFLN